MPLSLAKHQLDIGLATNDRDSMLRFWQDQVGVTYDGPLSVGGGVQQHRHSFKGSIIKINHARDGLPDAAPSGLKRVFFAREDQTEETTISDPDGNQITLVPPGAYGITQLGVEIGVRDVAAHADFWQHVVGLPRAPLTDRSGPHAFQCGDSILFLTHDPKASPDPERHGSGYRYLTLQVWDADRAHAGVLDRGGREGAPPFTHGAVARYSFIRDPDGNWIELSQRASLTGPVEGSNGK